MIKFEFKCVECFGKDEPCTLTVIQTKGTECQHPTLCPMDINWSDCKWKTISSPVGGVIINQ